MEALQLLSKSQIFDLEQPRHAGAPVLPVHAPGYVYTLHRHHTTGMKEARTGASGFIYTAEHSGTHIDAICHQAENMHLFGNQAITPIVQTSSGFTQLGVETIQPVITRGVLLDVAANKGVDYLSADQPVTQTDLESVVSEKDITIQQGNIVLIRTGSGQLWTNSTEYLQAAGITAGASRWLANKGVKAVGADNATWDVPNEVDAELNITYPGHVILLVRQGIYIMENLYLEELAKSGYTEFVFICLPLKMVGATASPVRPVALISA